MMSFVSTRLSLLIVFTLSGMGGFGFYANKSYEHLKNAQDQINESYDLEEQVEELVGSSYHKPTAEKLQDIRSRLQPAHRMTGLSDIIQSYAEGNQRVLRERVNLFRKNDIEFRRFSRGQMKFHQDRVQYYAILTFTVMSMGLVLINVFIRRSLLRPLKGLSRKMVDFLHDRYTYQFSVPEPNEVGHLQATFNSMAQRVLTNMEELRTLDQAKSDFLSIASHELRTPLTSIKGSLSLLRSGVVGTINEMAENLVKIAETETDRLIRLINDILDLAKIEARKLPLTQQWSAFGPLVATTLESLQGLAQAAGVQLAIEHMPSIEVHMDKDRIHQVLTNLLSNAIKYSPRGGTVRVNCDMNDQQQVVIEISDEGKGIDPHDQELIFQKFRQATSPKNPLVKGTGLGLAIAKALVEEHSGQIGVRSTPGQGSVFYFTLPQWRFAKDKTRGEEDSMGAAA